MYLTHAEIVGLCVGALSAHCIKEDILLDLNYFHREFDDYWLQMADENGVINFDPNGDYLKLIKNCFKHPGLSDLDVSDTAIYNTQALMAWNSQPF